MAHILVTDDAAFMHKVLRSLLEEHGHTVDEAGDGKECIQKAKVNDYDVITLDITMPEVSGLDALREIKKIKPAQKVVMVSAMGQQVMVIEAVQLGANEFIVKPFERDAVINAINKLLK